MAIILFFFRFHFFIIFSLCLINMAWRQTGPRAPPIDYQMAGKKKDSGKIISSFLSFYVILLHLSAEILFQFDGFLLILKMENNFPKWKKTQFFTNRATEIRQRWVSADIIFFHDDFPDVPSRKTFSTY